MANVIREDIVKLDFEVGGLKELTKLREDVEDLKKKLTGGIGDDALDDLKDSAEKATKPLEKVKETAEKIKKSVSEIGKKAAVTAFNGLKKLAGISFKALTVGIGAAATAVVGLVTKAVSAYAEFEQLKGGVETLFGAKGAKSVEEYAKIVGKSVGDAKGEYEKLKSVESTVMKNANNAFKDVGLSANQYMQTATSFSASLISSVGGDTKKAADLAHTAMVDMADNANKMGTDMGSLQYAYQGFAKQNYTMLDNLKLGYGGTKTEMQRLVKDAAKLDKSIDANSMSYGNIVKAIHAVQENMYITGTTQKEAEGTITGSLNMVKAAWGNLMPALIQGGDTFDQCIENLVYSVDKFSDNIIPAVEKALLGVGNLIEKLAPKFAEMFPSLAEKLIPPLIKAAVEIVKGLIKALPSIIKTLATTIVDIFGEQFPIIKKIGNMFAENAGKIANFIKPLIPVVIALVAAFKGFKAISAITAIFGKLKGSGRGRGKKSGGIFSGITNTFKELAKTKTSVILKGMANLSIILGGFALMSAALMAVAPHMAKLSDGKSLIEVIGVMAVLGLLGATLSKFAGIVGKIPIMTVVKGLANMAIVTAGMSALFLLIGAVSLINFDLNKLMHIIKIIAVLGTIGTVLSVFAGILGLIPIPVVLLGLANMGLVLGGMTALIVAFGALTQVKGFTEFIEKGGEILPKICNIIGDMAGSLIGGLAEGITDSLPQIGANLSAFAISLKPMLTMFQGADLAGIGGFFKSIGAFMLQMAGEGILSFFSGGTDLGKLGTQLNTFATKSEGFFTKVATFPENGFTNASKLFNCLAGVKSLPKEGGVVGWFTGNISYATLADGLAQLSSEKVIKFFSTVATLQQAGFDNAKLFFDCLAGVKGLPKDDGVTQWFTGSIKYDQIASGLGALAGEGVKNFFAMVSGFDKATFDNTKALFASLSSLSELPTEDGWWEKLTSNETTSLSDIATQLSDFASKTATFFTQVNSINLSNLNGLWASLKKPAEITTSVSKIVDDNIADIVKKITDLPKKMGDGIKSSGSSLSEALVAIWKDAVTETAKPVNKLIEGANWILKEFGSNKKIVAWTPYAKGTDGHKGGNALVNDGRGAELVQMPNGNTFIPQGRNVFLPNAPKGMKVLPAGQTARLMGRKSPTFHYADGVGDIDVWSYYDNAEGLISKLTSTISYKGISSFASNIGQSMVSTIANDMPAWADKLFKESVQSIGSYVASKGVMQWLPTVVRALKMEGLYSAGNVARTLFQMKTESGGNPRAINLWDSNAKKGIPSKGLMQVIDPTFKAYARDGFDKNIYDPLSNILASLRYATSRYGSLSKAYRGVGYSNGVGTVSLPSQPSTMNLSYTPESSSNVSHVSKFESNSYAPVLNFNIYSNGDTRTLKRDIKKCAREALQELFESMERRNPTLQEY